MNFYELEIWRPRPGSESAHADAIRAWFAYVKERRAELFTEWTAAHYFQEVLRNRDQATGRFVMLFGYDGYAGFIAYKERRKDWSGPYAEYKSLDPYPLFVPESIVTTHWQPHERRLWLDWRPTTPTSFFDVVCWTPLADKQREHDDTMRQWFAFVQAHHDSLFQEWRSAHYFRGVNRETGKANQRRMMIFEYDHREGFLAYKERRKDYAGPYQDYLKIDPFIYFDMDTKTQEFWQPCELVLWLDV
jgi:hypothetical protein